MTGAPSLVWKEVEVELFGTDAALHISIGPIFVGLFSTFRTASYFGFVCLSFPQLSSHNIFEPAELGMCLICVNTVWKLKGQGSYV